MPIVNADSARWSNANMAPAQAFKSRCTDPIESGKEVMRMAGQDAQPGQHVRAAVSQAETGSH